MNAVCEVCSLDAANAEDKQTPKAMSSVAREI